MVQATDPTNTEFELRQSDIDLIDSLNPSDAVLILGKGILSRVGPKWVEEWRASPLIDRLAKRSGRHGSTTWLRDQIIKSYPLRFVRDYAGHVLGSTVTISDRSLIAALQERGPSMPPPTRLFERVEITPSWKKQIRQNFVEQRLSVSADWQTELDDHPDDALVTYNLCESADRLRYILGLETPPPDEELQLPDDSPIRVGGLR